MVAMTRTILTPGCAVAKLVPERPATLAVRLPQCCSSDVRLTVAVVFVKPSMDTRSVLQQLLSAIRAAGLTIKCLFADKGFCSVAVLRYLAHCHIPAIMAMPIRGKKGSNRQLCRGRSSYRTKLHVAECRTWEADRASRGCT